MSYRIFLALILAWPWLPVTQRCATVEGNTIVLRCESGGLLSMQRYDLAYGLTVSAWVQGSSDDRYWAGLAINADAAHDDRYAEIATEQGIAPYQDDADPWIVSLATPAGDDWTLKLQDGDTAWHQLTIAYTPGLAVYIVDSVERGRTAVDLGDTAQIELVCVAVNPGESAPGQMATCQYRDVAVVG